MLEPEARLALSAGGLLQEFNAIGVLVAADVHVATRLAALAGERDEAVVLAAALAVRAPRVGHVYVDLATIRERATVDSEEPVDLSGLPWPSEWVAKVAASALVAVGDDAAERRRLRLVGTGLYLDRYWRDECQVAADLRALTGASAVDEAILADGLARLWGIEERDLGQRRAAEVAVRRRLAVVAGGPGTGKTTTVARIVALLAEQAGEMPLVALAAPTGKAATRLRQAVHDEAERLDVAPTGRDGLLSLRASTPHRLLGWQPGSHSRFRHHRGNRLPHDVVIVDETSMVSLTQMARLVEAVRPQARLVLVGDPGQLTSIEAGAVLGDIVGAGGPGVAVLERVHRGREGIKRLAPAIRRGDADAALEALQAGYPDVTWLPVDGADADELKLVREAAVAWASTVIDAARAGDVATALSSLGEFRLLCAHR